MYPVSPQPVDVTVRPRHGRDERGDQLDPPEAGRRRCFRESRHGQASATAASRPVKRSTQQLRGSSWRNHSNVSRVSTPSTCFTYVIRSPGSGVGRKTVAIAAGDPFSRSGSSPPVAPAARDPHPASEGRR